MKLWICVQGKTGGRKSLFGLTQPYDGIEHGVILCKNIRSAKMDFALDINVGSRSIPRMNSGWSCSPMMMSIYPTLQPISRMRLFSKQVGSKSSTRLSVHIYCVSSMTSLMNINIHLENALFERNRVEFDNHNIYLNNKFKNNGPSYTYQNFHIGKFAFAFSV